VKRERLQADCLGSTRGEDVERAVGLQRRCAARLRLDRVGALRPNESGSNEELYVERWKAVGNLVGRLTLIADELEHVTISCFHEPRVLVFTAQVAREYLRIEERELEAG